MPAPPPLRANVYVDGFNLYHGCFDDPTGTRASWRQFRWLDLDAYCAAAFPRYYINRIRYFTALVNPTPLNPDCRVRQLEYIRALETIPNLTVHRGRFATNTKKRKVADLAVRPPTPISPLQDVYVIEEREKASDVNLGSYLLFDAFQGEYDAAVIISNDADLITPITPARNELECSIDLVNPRNKCATAVRGKSDSYRVVRKGVLSVCQFPTVMHDANGVITRPASW